MWRLRSSTGFMLEHKVGEGGTDFYALPISVLNQHT